MPPASPPITPEAIMTLTNMLERIDADGAAETRVKSDEARAKTRHGEAAPKAVGGHQRKAEDEAEINVEGGSRRGNSALEAISGVAELAEPRASSGPFTSQLVKSTAIKFSMSVVTTSSTPRRARKRPGPISQAPPTRAEDASASGMRSAEGKFGEA